MERKYERWSGEETNQCYFTDYISGLMGNTFPSKRIPFASHYFCLHVIIMLILVFSNGPLRQPRPESTLSNLTSMSQKAQTAK
jgi:hypothetical protein